jgi:serine/threonine-protein kinase HipA
VARAGRVYVHDRLAGVIREDEEGFWFSYDPVYLADPEAAAVSLSLPLTAERYHDRALFPFFDGLIPEGWLLDIAERTWKLDPRDRMELLLACCEDCIGAVSVRREEESHGA